MVLVGLLPTTARAQGARAARSVEIRQYQPTPFSDGYLRLDGTATLPTWKLHAGLDLDYAWKSLVLIDVAPSIQRSRKTTYDFVAHAVGADLTLAMGLGGRFEVAALVPVTVFQTGDTVPGNVVLGTAGLENPKLGAKARLLGNGASGPGLGASVLVALPWGLGGPFVHETTAAVEGRLFGEFVQPRWSLRAGGGYRARAATQLFDITLDDELTFAAGGEVRIPGAELGIFAELDGATSAAHPLASSKQTPVELLIGGRREIGHSWLGGDNRFQLTVAGGPGPDAGVRLARGARVWLRSAGRTARPHGRRSPRRLRPARPRPPKPTPPPPPPAITDRDQDGILDDDDECPDEPEDKDGFEDEDGCPDPDNDRDGILDAADKCPNEPETINGIDDDDGCPDKGDAAVRIGKEELETLKPIFFETDHSRVRHAYYNVLAQIALTLKAHPEIGRCAVEGHTDDTGPPEWNQKLSVLRAEAVVEFLVGKGVERGRLTAIGHGEKLPWAPNDTESGRAKNRRVIFHIEGINSARREARRAPPAGARAQGRARSGGAGPRQGEASRRPATRRRRAPRRGPGPRRTRRHQRPRRRRRAAPKSPSTSPSTNPSTRTPPHPASKTAPASDDTPNFVPQPIPGQKKTATPPSNPNAPPTLRDLLRLPTEH